MSNLFQFHGPAVKKLLGWKQGDEEEKWAEKVRLRSFERKLLQAVDSLLKKLKKRKCGHGTLEDLEFALANPGAQSKCVTIPKSLDGRLQVSHKKGLPHVIYCRVWRWPDLQSHHELRSVAECLFPYDSRHPHICVNPYHYQRNEQPLAINGNQLLSQNYYSENKDALMSNGEMMEACSPSASSYVTATSPSALSDDDEMRSVASSPQYPILPLNSVQFWASIAYYELNTRVGELFKVSSQIVKVDGFTNPSNSEDRICLGLISNVNRNATTENTRKHIGRGVQFEYRDHNLFVTNLSESPVFVQSSNCNLKLNQAPNTVCRIPPQHGFCIFDYNILHRAQQEGYEQVYDIQKMCYVRLSFVKGWELGERLSFSGWGAEYPRQDVTSTPCWMELRLHNPLYWIDLVLQQMKDPVFNVTSVS